MRLKIEKWLIEQSLSRKVAPLFDEAIRSYKASAYKASLLFSYLGFMTILKERIIKSKLPPGICQEKWNQLKIHVQNIETWDRKVFETTQRNKPAQIFPISDTLKREVVYWKDRRNDCAHFKHEKIDYHHVESFWSFLETNLSKFCVNGGKASLIEKLKKHFDKSVTPPDQDINPLIVEIEFAVDVCDLKGFFADIKKELIDIWDNPIFEVYNEILEKYSNHIADELVEFIKADDDILLRFIRTFPDKIQYLSLNKEFIRELWYKKLVFKGVDDFKVYASLLRNNLICKKDIEEANQKIVKRLGRQIPDEHSKSVLEQNGFYSELKKHLFPDDGIFEFDISNKLSPLIVHYIKNFDLDEAIVISLIRTFSAPCQPYTLKDNLKTFFNKYPKKKQDLNNIINDLYGVGIPDSLDFIKIDENE